MEQSKLDQLVDSLLYRIKDGIHKSDDADHTFKARVTKKVSSNTYEVMRNGTTYHTQSSVPLVAGDMVWVCAPCNNWSDLFVVRKMI